VDLANPSADPYGLLVALQPKWGFEAGKLKLTIKYRIFTPDGTQQHASEVSQSGGLNITSPAAGFTVLAAKAMQLAMVDVLKVAAPTDAKFPSTGQLASLDYTQLINREQPVATGTGFFINKSGQLLTAAHVLQDCGLIEATHGERQMRVKRNAYSDLLDLAVVDTGEPTAKSIPLRFNQQMTLGEPVTNVGYPLQGLLAGSPNLTRGNVSARGGLKGSMGVFQFSAPIQPGSSGGPVVSDGGELLGITVSTLNAAVLIKEGLLPQNVNFALDARYAAAFLKRENIAFNEIPARTGGSMQQANDAALAAVVQLSCYQ
jgi:S1-C subfamily serine protease